MIGWMNDPHEAGVVWIGPLVDAGDLGERRMLVAGEQLRRYGHHLNQDGLRLARWVFWRGYHDLVAAGRGRRATELVNAAPLLALLGPKPMRVDRLEDWA